MSDGKKMRARRAKGTTEEQLREVQEQYRVLVESAGEVIARLSRDGTYLFVNGRGAELLGCKPKDVVGRKLSDFFPVKNARQHLAAVRRVIATGREYLGEAWTLVRGEARWYRTTVAPIRDSDGVARSVLIIARDETEWLRQTEALAHSDARYRMLMEQAGEGILISNPAGRILEANPELAHMAGMPIERIVNISVEEFLDKEDLPRYRERMADVKAGLTMHDVPYTVRLQNDVRHIEVSSRLMPDGNLISMVRDVTDRLASEQRVRESERLYRHLFESISDSIVVVALSGEFIDCNAAVLRNTGYSREEFLHLTTWDIVDHAYRSEMKSHVERLTKGESLEFESVHRRKDGSVMSVEVLAVPIEYAGAPAVLGVIRDITERKRMIEDLRRLARSLQRAREVERAAIAREVHDELGQLLTAMKLDLHWARERVKQDTVLAARLDSLTSIANTAIQSVKRIAAELRPVLLDDLGLAAAVEWHLGEFEKRTGLTCRLVFDVPIKLKHELQLVIFRLCQESLTNVARHAGASKVTVRVVKKDHGVDVTVEDNGKGIGAGRVYRPESSGISGMRERVQASGGEFEVVSSPGKGTTVHASLPLDVQKTGVRHGKNQDTVGRRSRRDA